MIREQIVWQNFGAVIPFSVVLLPSHGIKLILAGFVVTLALWWQIIVINEAD